MKLHQHDHGIHSGTTKNLRIAFFLNLAFTIVEIVGGILTNSIAIMSDALHDLGDTFSLGVSWYFQYFSQKEPDKKYTYGYKRYSVIGALITSIVLLLGSVYIFIESIPRFYHPEDADASGMILLAVFGIIANGLAVLRLRKGDSLNERAVMLHLMEDVLGWVAVLFGAIIMYFFEWQIIDPILSLLIALYILLNVYRNLKLVMKVILQGVPDNVSFDAIQDYFKSHPQIQQFHDLHIWSLDGNYNVLSIHIQLEEQLSLERTAQIKSAIREDLQSFNVQHATLEFDFKGIPCDFQENFYSQ